ncbi:DENN domain, uDENN domain protein [Artemisia annua]|uniref:DENN domain, uDENN domain protein n=1 Tax=Artemisia annua TaxID=35608 RepID=A0A2U1N6M0_ARTAN|nr:DENN domain, uDENN domain protein [Artemisia annua]
MTTVGPGGHRRCRSEVVTSLNTQNNGFQRLKTHMQRALNWGGSQEQAFFNPEILAHQKRQWYQFQSRSSDTAKYQDPTSLFEHFLIAGIHPNANLGPVEDAFATRKKWEAKSEKTDLMDLKVMQFRSPPSVMMEPQILFKYPPDKRLSMRLVDLASFCFPEGVKAHVMRRSPSLSELNQIVYGQEHLSRDDLSFIFSLKVADNATLYGVCLHTQEFVQRPPGMLRDASPLRRAPGGGSRFLVTAPRCYCLLTRERLNRITQFVSEVSLDHIPSSPKVYNQEDESSPSKGRSWMDSAIRVDGTLALSALSAGIIEDVLTSPSKSRTNSPNNRNSDASDKRWEYLGKVHDDHDSIRKAGIEACVVPVTPKLGRIGSSGPLFSSVRGIVTEDEDGVLSCSGKDATDKTIMEWAKENKNDLLQIVCSYHDLPVPKYGGKVYFKPFEHLQAIEYYRTAFAFGEDPDVDMSLIPDKVKFKLAAIEEAVSLSNWTTITLCRALSLQNVLILLAAVLLEKQVIITSPNLGVLSATVLSLIPMILPFEWQSLFLPVLPGKMFEFLDAPVPFVVGILHKPADNKMKMSNNLVHVDLDDNQVEMSSLPALPKQRELMTRLGPLHARLSSDKTSSKKHPVYRCNKWQIDAATQFLSAMRQHLESLCSNLSNHTITNVQNNDRVSLLLKESYIDSFSYRDRPFVREFVDTQMFTVLSDTRLSRPDC